MYIYSRRSCAQREAMEDLYMGSIQDINEGRMIAVLTTEDPHGYPLCIEKLINIEKKMEMLLQLKCIGMQHVHTHSMVCTSQRWWFRNMSIEREK
jgi:hypothetical protein